MKISKKFAAIALAGSFLLAAPAFADGPSGSKESNNNVTCNRTSGGGASGGNVYANGISVGGGAGGVESCSDTGAVQGRVIVSSSGSVAADGDKDNAEQAQGWAKLSSAGPTCGTGDSVKNEKPKPCGD